MIYYRDTIEGRHYFRDVKRDIPNTFNTDLLENKDFSITEVIFLIDKGFVERKDIPADVLKRVDAEIEFRNADIRKKYIPREFVNPAYATEKLSIWEIVQLSRHGAVDFSLMPKVIKDKVDVELDRRHQVYEKKIRGSKPLS